MSPGNPEPIGRGQSGPEPASEQTTFSEIHAGQAGRPTTELQIQERKRSYRVLMVLTAAALYVAYIVYSPFLKSLFLALVLTIAFWPIYRWLAQRVHGANWRAFIVTCVVVLTIMIPLMLVSLKFVSEAASLYGYVSQNVAGSWSSQFSWATEALARLAEQTGIPATQLKSTVASQVQNVGSWLVGIAGWAVRGFAQQVGSAVLTLLIMFFFLRDSEKYTRALSQSLPLSPRRVQQLSATLRDAVVSNIYGMVAVGFIQGALLSVGWWMAGLRAPILWGAIATIVSLLPLVGPAIVWWPGVIVLAVQGRWIQALVLVVWGFVVTAADYLIRPRFAGGSSKPNTLLVLLSLIGGLRAFGAIGIIAGPVVLSVLIALLTMIREEQRDLNEARNLAA